MRGYKLAAAADADLLEIWAYVFDLAGADGRANRVVRELHETFARLAEYPELGGYRDRFGPGVLVFPKGQYLVLYRVSVDSVEIVRVTGADSDVFSDE